MSDNPLLSPPIPSGEHTPAHRPSPERIGHFLIATDAPPRRLLHTLHPFRHTIEPLRRNDDSNHAVYKLWYACETVLDEGGGGRGEVCSRRAGP